MDKESKAKETVPTTSVGRWLQFGAQIFVPENNFPSEAKFVISIKVPDKMVSDYLKSHDKTLAETFLDILGRTFAEMAGEEPARVMRTSAPEGIYT